MKRFLHPLLVLAGATPLLAAIPADFRSSRDLSGPAVDAPCLAEIRLDAHLMADTRPGFPDLRLFDAELREIPRLVEPLFTTQTRLVRNPVGARATELRELPGNRIEARFDLEPGVPSPTALDIRTTLRDFIRTVRISGSDDGQYWRPLVETDIFDYARYMGIRRTWIELPENSCRHFAIEIDNATEERAQPLVHLVQKNRKEQSRALELLRTPFQISGISFFQNVPSTVNDAPVLQEWPAAAMKVREDYMARITEIILDTRFAPVTRIVFETPSRNFNRIATIQVPTVVKGKDSWRTVDDGIISCVDIPGYSTNRLSVDFAEQRTGQLRVIIQNTDNPPLKISAVRPYGPVYRLLWLAEPAATYRLASGNNTLAQPYYDLFAIRTALEKGVDPALWQLAAAPPPPPVAARPFSFGEFVSRPFVFGSLLAVAALALLFLLAKALKKAP